ncbi:MAG: carboxypeptidase-like regulatory domain-containing protein, partial [Planctomycetota bacterium]
VPGPDGLFLPEGVGGVGKPVELRAGHEPGPLPPGVDPRPFAPGIRRDVEPGGPPLKLVLPRTKILRFRVLDGIDDAPLPYVHVIVRTDEGAVLVDRAVAPIDGRIELAGLTPRGYELALLSPVHRLLRTVPLKAHEDPGSSIDLGDLRLPHGIRVAGKITDTRGRAVVGAKVAGLDTGWFRSRSPDPTKRRELLLRWVEADDDGVFVIEGFDPRATAVLAVWAPGFAPTARRVVLEEFRDDVHANLRVALRRGGYFRVRLVQQGTQDPVTGALLDLEDARNGSDYLDLLRRSMLGGPVATTEDLRRASAHFLMENQGEAGLYRLGPIQAGPYEIWVDRPGYQLLKRRLTIIDTDDDLIDLIRGTSRAVGEPLTQTWAMKPAPR